jgi:hypothetical protein
MAMDESSGFRKSDGATIVNSVAGNSLGTALAWSWLQFEWAAIRTYYDNVVSSPVARMVTGVTESFNTAEELAELEQFAADNANNLGTAQRATEAAIVATAANIDWMQSYFDIIVDWLQAAVLDSGAAVRSVSNGLVVGVASAVSFVASRQ